MRRWFRYLALICVASTAMNAVAAHAQSAFKGPLKILVGFAAGGSSDVAARMLADTGAVVDHPGDGHRRDAGFSCDITDGYTHQADNDLR